MSRAGTSSMVEALNLRDDICAYGETKFFGLAAAARPVLNAADLDRLAAHYRGGHLGTLAPRDGQALRPGEISRAVAGAICGLEAPIPRMTVFRAMGEAVARFCGKAHWVEKTPHHLMHLDQIICEAPDTRVVVVIRSPGRFLLSYKHQGDRKAPRVRKVFHRMYHPFLAALVCRGYLRAALRSRQRFAGNVLIVKLEELQNAPDELAYTPIRIKTPVLQLAYSIVTLVFWPARNARTLFQIRYSVRSAILRWIRWA